MGLSKQLAALVDEGFFMRLFRDTVEHWEVILWKGDGIYRSEVARGFGPTPQAALEIARERYRIVESKT